MRRFSFRGWFKNCFQYENHEYIVEIREYDYRDNFGPTITDDELISLFNADDDIRITFFNRDELRKQGKLQKES